MAGNSNSAKELITERGFQTPNSGSAQEVIKIKNGGSTPGTFADKLIAISYAGWISPKFQLIVNQVFADFQEGKKTAQNPVQDLAPIRNNFLCYIDIAKACGLDTNQSAIHANRAMMNIHNANVLEIGGITHLESDSNEADYPVRYIGEKLGLSPQKTNALLIEKGLQIKTRDNGINIYTPTAKGEPHSKVYDTAIRDKGTSKRQVKWRESVIPLLRESLPDPKPKITAIREQLAQ